MQDIRTICAQCKAHMHGNEDAPLISHSLCPHCLDAFRQQLLAIKPTIESKTTNGDDQQPATETR